MSLAVTDLEVTCECLSVLFIKPVVLLFLLCSHKDLLPIQLQVKQPIVNEHTHTYTKFRKKQKEETWEPKCVKVALK